ncbi:MAG: hypothetical protein MUC62_03805 [Candidatus Thermoplasmatota archaeon]|jgi:hypothetical protein|nr:hypothetical protein [Candidatus Thermoplasmatota archaeon]
MKEKEFLNIQMIFSFIICLITIIFYIYSIVFISRNLSQNFSVVLDYTLYLFPLLVPAFGISFFIYINSYSYLKYIITEDKLYLIRKYFFINKKLNIPFKKVFRVLVVGPNEGNYFSVIISNKEGGRWISLFCNNQAYYIYTPSNVYTELRKTIPLEFEFLDGIEVKKLTKEYNRKIIN